MRIHTTAITDVAVETKGNLVATCDNAGIIMIHVLVPAKSIPQVEMVCPHIQHAYEIVGPNPVIACSHDALVHPGCITGLSCGSS
jgi:hypothetical protein